MNEAVDLQGTRLIVLTEDEYKALIEDAADIVLADEAIAQAKSSGSPSMPGDLMMASLNGTLHPLAAWRKAVGLSQSELAKAANLRPATVSDIESGKIDPRLSTLKALATALKLGVEDIID